MQLPSQQVAKFQQIYRETFGKDIDAVEAQRQGLQLVRLMKLLTSPTKENEHELRKPKSK